jgi:hypothetical protein
MISSDFNDYKDQRNQWFKNPGNPANHGSDNRAINRPARSQTPLKRADYSWDLNL